MPARAQLRIITAVSLAGLLFGFGTAVVSGITQSLRTVFDLTPMGLGVAVSAALWGTVVASVSLGRVGDRFGSREALKGVGALYLLSALGCALAWNLTSFVLCRFLTGLAIGGSSILAPIYITEVSPAEERGARVGQFQINVVVGILLAYLSNFILDAAVDGAAVWRWKLAVAALPALLFLAVMQLVPRSPRWLISKGRLEEAIASLRALGNPSPESAARQIDAAEAAAQRTVRSDTPADRLSWRRHRKPIILAIAIGMFNQLSGINAILYYLGDIFSFAGFNTLSANAQSVVVGMANLVVTLAAMTLIDRVGRKPLLLAGSVITALAQGAVAAILFAGHGQKLLLPLLVVFIVGFAASQGAVIWVYLSEIFPTSVRARGQSVGVAAHWITNAMLAGAFPSMAALSKSLPFFFFSAMMVLQLLFVAFYLPETKGVELESMDRAVSGSP